MKKRQAMVALLKAFDLRVVSWDRAVAETGTAAPYTGDVVRAGMDMADAVVVLMTPDDVGSLKPEFQRERDDAHETTPTGQARLNVVFEAGMAMALDRKKVLLVEVGAVRPMSDIAGVNVVRLTNSVDTRRSVARRLQTMGLAVDTDHEEWRDAGDFTTEAPLPPIGHARARTGSDAPGDASAHPSPRPAGEDPFFLRQHVYTRGSDEATVSRVLKFLDGLTERGAIVEVGTSDRTADGYSDYLMVRDAGPRRFGAIAYVRPSNGGLTLRLTSSDVSDVSDPRVKLRNVKSDHEYVVTCRLVDERAVQLAIELAERALAKVRRPR